MDDDSTAGSADTINTSTDTSSAGSSDAAADVLLDDELLVEEISIDGMCGVY
jgi:mycofactocin precursor